MAIKIGDYVIGTKYADGDPMDPWCVGFYAGTTLASNTQKIRYLIADDQGRTFRSDGFARVKKITQTAGNFLLQNKDHVERSGRSIYSIIRLVNQDK
jgi:hypothetical protein